jgi:hypothetical protein
MTKLHEHVSAINEWIDEACQENPDVSDVEIQCDIVTSYIAAEVGSESLPMSKEIRRAYGLER